MRYASTGIAVVIAALLLLCILLPFKDNVRSALTLSIPLENADAIVILAGTYEERVPPAAALYRTGHYQRILLPNDGIRKGWSRELQRSFYGIEQSEAALIRQGVPRQAIVKLPYYKSGTVYDALAVRDYIITHDIRSIVLVTSDYHTRRAHWIFERVLRHLPVTIAVVPAQSRVTLFPEIALEYIKLTYYRIRYGMMDDIP